MFSLPGEYEVGRRWTGLLGDKVCSERGGKEKTRELEECIVER